VGERVAGQRRRADGRSAGMPDYKFAVVGPISGASDAQLAEYARATLDQARGMLLRPR